MNWARLFPWKFAPVAKRQGSDLQSPDRAVQLPPGAPTEFGAVVRYRAMKALFDGSFEITLNMSDTFAFACADAETFDLADFEPMIPILNKYGHDALTAYVAVKRDSKPIKCRCCHDGPQYESARKEILELQEEGRISI